MSNTQEQNIQTNEDDYLVIKNILNGNHNDFAKLQKKYRSIILALIRRMIKDEDDVQDLTQETFIKAFNNMDKFQFGYSFSSWIYRIASNNCIDFLRKKRISFVSIDKPISISEDDDITMEIEDKEYMPDLSLITAEKSNAIKNAIDELPENYREIINLRHIEELDYQEIADKLNMPLGTVKAHLFRARKLLYESLKSKLYLFNDY
ncbi:MAG: sigma-70 family RNA polymerase sigma factor [Candidatus Kapabacteria bacterium]|nr:sigma-70 family RNA polymerase sigma factor [Candidatus Kapabacteria bacterium]